MDKELTIIFIKTLNAHFPNKIGISKNNYVKKFKTILTKEITDAPTLDGEQGNLATYLKLSVLVMTMVKLHQELGLGEGEIGELIYRTADEYYRLSRLKRWIQRHLFFSKLNRKQILARQIRSEQLKNGINGFRIKYIAGANRSEFGVDYLRCGICDYFARKDMFEYVKYCCLVDYAIMKNLGISFSRTTTLGNGGNKCDFRFAKKGRLEAGWPPTNLKEFKQE